MKVHFYFGGEYTKNCWIWEAGGFVFESLFVVIVCLLVKYSECVFTGAPF